MEPIPGSGDHQGHSRGVTGNNGADLPVLRDRTDCLPLVVGQAEADPARKIIGLPCRSGLGLPKVSLYAGATFS
jgi:hypothetical protein